MTSIHKYSGQFDLQTTDFGRKILYVSCGEKLSQKCYPWKKKTSGAQTHNKKCSKKHSKRRSDPDFCNRGQGRRNCAF